MDRREFFKLMEGHRVGKATSTEAQLFGKAKGAVKSVGKGIRHVATSAFGAGKYVADFASINKGAIAKGAGALAATAGVVGGGLAFMRRRAGKKAAAAGMASKAAEAAEAAKPMGRLKAAGGKALSAIKGNPKKALAAGAAGLTGMMFMRRKSKKDKRVVAGAVGAGLAGAGGIALHRAYKAHKLPFIKPPHDTFKYTRGLGKVGVGLGAVNGALNGGTLGHVAGHAAIGGVNWASTGAIVDAIRHLRRK